MIGKKQNDKICALCEWLAEAFVVSFVQLKKAYLNLREADQRLVERYSKVIKQDRDMMD